MKITKTLVVAAVVGVCALSARADFSITLSQPTITISPSTGSQSGTLTFAISGNAPFTAKSGTLAGKLISDVVPTGLAFTGSPGVTGTLLNPTGGTYSLAASTTYQMVVDWTLSSASPGDTDLVQLDFLGNPGSGNTDYTLNGTINVSQVPEPAQTVAGAMLVGCGTLVFASRRLLKKQVA